MPRKGPDVADENTTVTISHPLYGERQIEKGAEPFFTNQGYKVVSAAKSSTPTTKKD